MVRAGHACRFAVVAVALLSPLAAARADSPDLLADQVREVFRQHCVECHGGKQTRAELNILNAGSLFRRDRPLVKPLDPNDSELLQLVECGTMPPGTRPKVPEKERQLLREWIVAGGRPFPAESSDLYALTKILLDVRAAATEPGRNLADERYVTLNHLLANPDTAADLDIYRAALNKALNQLSTKAVFVTPRPIDPAATIYRLKLSELGWDIHLFAHNSKNPKDIDETTVNLYDLLLLDYPLASLPDHSSEVAEDVVGEYLAQVKLLRPIPYLRGDWLASVATQAPLYHDLLRLPLSVADLEKRLGFGANVKTARAALTKSAVVRGDRLIERRSTDNGFYWRTYDRATRNDKTLLADAAATHPSGGAALFRLPNGLPGYFIADPRGVRLDALPTATLHNALAKEGVGNGLSCMICHANGLRPLGGEGRYEKGLPVTFPPKAEFDKLLDRDNEGFAAALRQTLQGLTAAEPLGPVSRRFYKGLTQRRPKSDITLVNLDSTPHKPSLLDARYVMDGGAPLPLLVRGNPQPPTPILPFDAHSPARFAGKDATVKFELTTVEVVLEADGETEKLVKPTTTFRPGAHMALVIKNTSDLTMYFEVALTETTGTVTLFRLLYTLEPGKEIRVSPKGFFTVTPLDEGEPAKQRFTVYAAAEKFPLGSVLNLPDKPEPGYHVAGRVVHPLYQIDGKKIVVAFDPAKLVRQTVEFETLTK